MYSPIAIKRGEVLGEIYKYCDTVESIPVFLNDASGEMLGQVDESLGCYADTFLFHLPEDICKKLSSNYYKFSFDYEDLYNEIDKKRHIKLNHIMLVGKAGRTPPQQKLKKKS
jgi:hypothetical protein